MVGVLHHMVNDPAQVLVEVAMRWMLEKLDATCLIATMRVRRFDAMEQDLIEFGRAHGHEGSGFHLRPRDTVILVDSAAIFPLHPAISG